MNHSFNKGLKRSFLMLYHLLFPKLNKYFNKILDDIANSFYSPRKLISIK